MRSTAGLLCLCLFILLSVIHLYHSLKDDAKKRARTKPFLLLFLLLFYLCYAAHPIPTLVAALVTSWLGDVLLMIPGDKWFFFGGISFGFAHLLFVATYLTRIRWDGMPWRIVIPAALFYLAVSVWVIRELDKIVPKKMLAPMHVYLVLNATMNLFALMQLLTLQRAGALIAYLGALLFFLSDCVLYFVRYHDNPQIIPGRHFTVMAAYLAGEGLITLGMLKISQYLS